MSEKIDPTKTTRMDELPTLPPAPVKPGVYSTEFWLHLLAVLLAAAVSLGLLSSANADAVWQVIGAAAVAIGGTFSATAYGNNRTKLKGGE